MSMPLAQAKSILVFGDSLSAAYGMDLEQGWAHLLSESLGPEHSLTNASISGETTSGGRARFELTLEEFKPEVVLLELGANDGLQGLSLDEMRNNLAQMIELSKEQGAVVALAGISLPPSYGPRYIDKFRSIFTDLAQEYDLAFIAQPLIRDLVLDFLRQNKLLD